LSPKEYNLLPHPKMSAIFIKNNLSMNNYMEGDKEASCTSIQQLNLSRKRKVDNFCDCISLGLKGSIKF
jgi:hypothetical protein